ncbi:MAG: hypothetical protein HYV60_20790 [Planctomycetia bacterium]|nr:hypothetical protein [Planctomycetia bacterium]
MLNQIHGELLRVGASDILVSMDEDFAPTVGSLLKIEIGDAYWHLLPGTLQDLLSELPDNAGSDAVHWTIEANALPVWHGPAPESAEHE